MLVVANGLRMLPESGASPSFEEVSRRVRPQRRRQQDLHGQLRPGLLHVDHTVAPDSDGSDRSRAAATALSSTEVAPARSPDSAMMAARSAAASVRTDPL